MATNFAEDWQSSKNTVLQRNSYMFKNSMMSDVAFNCKDSIRIFRAHKYILATSSSVFYTMFYGATARPNTILHLEDTDDASLEEFLRFLYTDHCFFTENNVMTILHLSKKYVIPSLTQKCVDYLKEKIVASNALFMLENPLLTDALELRDKCWRVFDLHTLDALHSDSFLNINITTLTDILKRETMRLEEVDLFKAVVRWCDARLLKANLPNSGWNRRSLLGDAIFEICFTAMSEEEFEENVAKSGILTENDIQELRRMLKDKNGSSRISSKWKAGRNKTPPTLFRIARFHTKHVKKHVDNTKRLLQYEFKPDAVHCLSFKATKDVQLHGIRLFGRNNAHYDVVLQVGESLKVQGLFSSELDKDGIPGYDVMLPVPLLITRSITYDLFAAINGPSSAYGSNGIDVVERNGVIFTFTNYRNQRKDDLKTTTQEGQFYHLIVSF